MIIYDQRPLKPQTLKFLLCTNRVSIIYIIIAEARYIRQRLFGGRGQCYWITGTFSFGVNFLHP